MKLFTLVVTAFALIVLLAVVYRFTVFRHIRYARVLDRYRCAEGDEVELIETIVNDKWLPLPWVRLESLLSANLAFRSHFETDINGGEMYQHHKSLFSLPPYTQIVRKHTFQCRKRGCYRMSSVTMTAGDPFGIVSQTMSVPTAAELLVYPQPEAPALPPVMYSGWQGELEVKRWIVDDPFLTEGVRGYRAGDPMNAIHWKASARTGALQVHRRAQTADNRLHVFLNFDVTEDMWKAVTDPELIERGIRHAAYFCGQAALAGLMVGFTCNGRTVDAGRYEPVRISPAGGRGHLDYILESLARLTIERTTGFDTLLEEEPAGRTERTDYVIISAFVSIAVEQQLERLRRSGSTVQVVPLVHPVTGEDAHAKLA